MAKRYLKRLFYTVAIALVIVAGYFVQNSSGVTALGSWQPWTDNGTTLSTTKSVAMGKTTSGEINSLRYAIMDSAGSETNPNSYLYRYFTADGIYGDMYYFFVPYARDRYAGYGFKTDSASNMTLAFLSDAVPVVNTLASAVTKTGTWTLYEHAQMYNGGSYRSEVEGDTAAASITGHTLFIRAYLASNCGFALVAIDDDYTAATALPAVTAADVAAGYFAAGDVGKRYINFYRAADYFNYDEFILLAEGLSDAAHTVTLYVTATRQTESTANRIYFSSFCGATGGTVPSGAGNSMAHVRYVYNIKSATAGGALGCAISYKPTGADAQEWAGEWHGNSTQVSATFRDSAEAALTPANGEWATGKNMSLEIIASLLHSETGATVNATRILRHTTESGGRLKNSFQLDWKAGGSVIAAYTGMLTTGFLSLNNVLVNVNYFDRGFVGEMTGLDLTVNGGAWNGKLYRDFQGFYSDDHDTVAALYSPNSAVSLNNWADCAAEGANYGGAAIVDNANNTDKAYFTKIGASKTIVAGDRWDAVWVHRIFRIPNAATFIETF